MAEPAPSYVEEIAATAERPLLILCDHAGKEVPGGLGLLGIDAAALSRHIGWDIGAADLTRGLARRLGAAAVLDHCSRLVIDPNRRPGSATSVPAVSDDCVIPGNQGLDATDLRERAGRYFLPYHRAVARRIAAFRRAGRDPAVVSVHSFTPRMNGEDRPWQVGVLWRHDRRIADPALERLRARGDLVVGDNQPYAVGDGTDYTIPVHGEGRGLITSGIEIRQNEIAEPEGQRRWAERLIRILGEIEIELRNKGLA